MAYKNTVAEGSSSSEEPRAKPKKAPRYSYPTYRFPRSGDPVRVETEEEDRALIGEWFDHPPSSDEDDDRFPEAADPVDAMIDEESGAEKKKSKGKGKK